MKKKIVIYSRSLAFGGAERIAIYLTRYFYLQNIEVSILTSEYSSFEYPVEAQFKRVSLSKKNEKLNNYNISRRMKEYLKKESPDLLIVLGTPLIMHLIFSFKLPETKIIVSERNSPQNFSGKKITKFISNKLFNFADGFVFQTEGASEYYHWIRNNKKIIPNPLFVDELPDPYSGKRRKKIVSVGRLHKQKNQKLLIEAFSLISHKHPDYNLVIYGEGNERENLETLIQSLNLTDRIYLPGSTQDVLAKIKDASIFAFSSDFEGMPNALIEAMALGLPVISTDCPSGGPRELINHGVNGLLTPVKDKEKFAEQLNHLLSNPEKAAELGKEGIGIREKLNAEKIGQKWLDFSLKIMDKDS